LSKRILVVDDDPDIRQILLDRLSSYGYAVETAINGREALDALRRGGFDGMLLDIRMPEIDGLEVLRQTRARERDAAIQPDVAIKIVVFTAFTTPETTRQAIAEGAQGYLFKPFDSSQLKQVVEQYFGPAV